MHKDDILLLKHYVSTRKNFIVENYASTIKFFLWIIRYVSTIKCFFGHKICVGYEGIDIAKKNCNFYVH